MKKLALPRLMLSAGILLLMAPAAIGQDAPQLYKTTLVQAAPGKIGELISLYKKRFASDARIAAPAPMWMRHSQGDQWDLLLLTPVGSYLDYYSPERIATRQQSERSERWREQFAALIAWQEDVYVYGPPMEELRKAFAAGGFFHVEMFVALAGKHAELRRQREMENAYLKSLGRPQNFIFVRDQGAAWDLFTIGIYRDLKHYAESADLPQEKQEAAAKAAGFSSASDIGPYLRTLIRTHHDTLCGPVK